MTHSSPLPSLRQRIGRGLRRAVGKVLHADLAQLRHDLVLAEATSVASKTGQLLLASQWRQMAARGEPLQRLNDSEFRAFSQNGEDGILLYLFSVLGTAAGKTCVEICAGDGIQCNAANLILNHGWNALLVDGDEENIARGERFYAGHGDTFGFPPRFAREWVDRETVNPMIKRHGFSGEIDLLSIDLDGVDYWIWEAIDVIRPRVVIAEVQCIWGAERALTVPYRRDFRSPLVEGFGIYSGASLPAFVKLARAKGYRLVGTQALGFNAFFVREGLGTELLPEVSAAECLDRPFVRWAAGRFLPLVQDREWVEV